MEFLEELGAKRFLVLGVRVVWGEGSPVIKVEWQMLRYFLWVHHLCCRMIGQSVASWGYSWWWGQVLHLRRWDQGDSQSFVTCSIHKYS